ncbi:MAG: TlpA family protein disulfide reductase [Planctomycetes bacterium]|nr:TlpA family protein disulfide reductase [Planctomycetota bacterium]
MFRKTCSGFLFLCLFTSCVFSKPSKDTAKTDSIWENLTKEIQSLSDSMPDKPAPGSTDKERDEWRMQDYKIRQKRIETIEKLELQGLSDEQLKPYYVMKVDDIESCFHFARSEANRYEAKLYSMMDNSTLQGKILSTELFWKLNLYHINTHLMHISEADLQQIAEFELSRKTNPEAGRLMVRAIDRARPGYDAKVKWSTWVFDNMSSESEGYKLLSAINRKKSDIGKQFEFEGSDLNGNVITAKSLRGKVVLIDFWALWCGFCLQEIPKIQELHEKYSDHGLCVLGVFNDYRIDELKEYLKDNKATWTQLIDTKASKESFMHPLAQRYGISGLPEYLLIDKKGNLVKFAGRVDILKSDIEKLIANQ